MTTTSMKNLLKAFALSIIVASSSAAHAVTNYYFMPCDAGYDTALAATCPVDNSKNGLSRYPGFLDDGVTANPAYGPKRDMSGFNTTGLPAGGVNLNFAKGSYWAHSNTTIVPGYSAAAAGAGLTIQPYTPPKGCGACAAPIIHWPGTPGSDEGIYLPGGQHFLTIQGMDLRGGNHGTVTAGVSYVGSGLEAYGGSTGVNFLNNKVHGFALGIAMEPGGAGTLSKQWVVRGNLFTNLSGQGWYGGGDDILIENNQFIQNGFYRQTYDHNIYLSGGAMHTRGITVRGNVLKQANDDGSGCKATSLVAHKWMDDLTIENNYIEETQASGGCYGIQANSYPDARQFTSFKNLVIRGNRLVNVGGVGISCNSCDGAVIENNSIAWTTPHAFTTIGIAVPDGTGPNASDRADGHAKIRNNFLYMGHVNNLSRAIHLDVNSQNHAVVSNLIVFPSTANAAAKCFMTNGKPLAWFAAFDYNRCGGTATWSDQFSTLAAAQAASWDVHSLNTSPNLAAVPAANTPTYVPACIGGCGNGHPTLSSRIGIDSKGPNATREIGPDVSGPVKTAPAAPVWRR